jgi:hypothetical protein
VVDRMEMWERKRKEKIDFEREERLRKEVSRYLLEYNVCMWRLTT